MARSKAQVRADAAAATAQGAKTTVLPVGAKGRPRATPQVDALPGMAPLGLAPKAGNTLAAEAAAAKAALAKASRAAAPVRAKGVAKAVKAQAPKGGRTGRFADDGAKLAPVAGAPARAGVLGHIQAQVAKGAAFGAIRDSLAANFVAAKADPQRFAVRFVGRAMRRGLVQLAGQGA